MNGVIAFAIGSLTDRLLLIPPLYKRRHRCPGGPRGICTLPLEGNALRCVFKLVLRDSCEILGASRELRGLVRSAAVSYQRHFQISSRDRQVHRVITGCLLTQANLKSRRDKFGDAFSFAADACRLSSTARASDRSRDQLRSKPVCERGWRSMSGGRRGKSILQSTEHRLVFQERSTLARSVPPRVVIFNYARGTPDEKSALSSIPPSWPVKAVND
jgi:hypothetical protein